MTEYTNDVINHIALTHCRDTTHRIFFTHGTDLDSLTLAELDERATKVAHELRSHGVGERDRVGVMAGNRIEWVLLDLAVLKLGAVIAGFEVGRFAASELVDTYGLKMLFVEPPESGDGYASPTGDVLSIDIVAQWSESTVPWPVLAPHLGYDAADVLAIKFTSGSTGTPKGLEASVGSVNDSLAAVQEMFAHGDGDNILVFLRLALLQQRYWIYSALVYGHDVTIATIDTALAAARAAAPTVVMGVPAFYEDLKRRLEADVEGPDGRGAQIQAALGGRIRYLWTGSAPASRAVLMFFNDAGVPLYEGYGLNETCIVAKNHPGAFRLGSVGKVLPNKRIRFDRDGVLIVGSRHPVNHRYTWAAPGVSERMFLPTAEVKTYDVGYVDADGFLYIEGRVDDLLTLSSGRNVMVRLVEEAVRAHPDVHDCVLFGNGRDFLTAIISPAKPASDPAAIARHVGELNDSLLSEQRLHALVVTSERFSLANNLLSSQFKPRRAEIHRRVADKLAFIYRQGPVCPPATPHVVVEGSVRTDFERCDS